MKYMIIGLFLLFAGNIYAQVRGTALLSYISFFLKLLSKE